MMKAVCSNVYRYYYSYFYCKKKVRAFVMPVTERFPPTLKGHFDQSCVKKPAVWTTSPYSGFSYFHNK